MDLKPVLKAVLDEYQLAWTGPHGIGHWARVLENGLWLAPESGADVVVVKLFAVLHDSRRRNDVSDPEHGLRAADFVRSLQGRLLQLPQAALCLLCRACEGHSHERTHPDATIQTCWDADRLDLGRVGITPHPSRLCTAAARRPETIHRAEGRARFGVVPQFVRTDWGLDLQECAAGACYSGQAGRETSTGERPVPGSMSYEAGRCASSEGR